MSKITTLHPRPAAPPPTTGAGERRPMLVTYEEAARRLGGVSIRHVENLVARGELRRKGRGKARGIVESSLDRYIEDEGDDG